uniref:Aspartate dehydrogenase domain containing n=1 Tax=Sinocyclocheilus grahami TaxID=75366 RepID=A0A672L363_SINGR
MTDRALKVGIVGYGHLGQFLLQPEGCNQLRDSLPKELILHDLSDFTLCMHMYVAFLFKWKRDSKAESITVALTCVLCVCLALSIRMSKHPPCFRLTGGLLSDWMEGEGRRVLYNGSVAELCPIAPNNVNTMAVAAIDASKLGFHGVTGEIVSDTVLSDYHIVEAEVTGPDGFTVKTVRQNPAKLGAVTGNATYNSFWSSLLVCKGHGGRVYRC